MAVKQGEIFLADLSHVVGSEQSEIRPVVVVQNNILNRFSPTVIVSAITTRIYKTKLPTHVLLSKEKYSLKMDSVIQLEQIKTIDKSRLLEKIDILRPEDLDEVKKGWIDLGDISQSPDSESTLEIETFYKFIKDNTYDQIENIDFEFKHTANPLRMIKDTIARYVCSFLNAHGGRVLYGITDEERIVKGMNLSSENIDEIKLAIYDKVRGVNPGISPDQLKITFHDLFDQSNEKIQDEYILEVFVPALEDKRTIHYIGNGRELIVRVDGSSRQLQGSEIASFVLNKYNIT